MSFFLSLLQDMKQGVTCIMCRSWRHNAFWCDYWIIPNCGRKIVWKLVHSWHFIDTDSRNHKCRRQRHNVDRLWFSLRYQMCIRLTHGLGFFLVKLLKDERELSKHQKPGENKSLVMSILVVEQIKAWHCVVSFFKAATLMKRLGR